MSIFIKKKFIGEGQVDGAKILVLNNQPIRAKNTSGTAVDLFKLDPSNQLQFLIPPKVTSLPTDNSDLANKAYVDELVSSQVYKPKKIKKVVDSDVFSNQYFEINELLDDEASLLFLNSRPLIEGEDYQITRLTNKTRFTLIGSILPGQVEGMEINDIITGIYFVQS